jgi:signal transduction histidine kinase
MSGLGCRYTAEVTDHFSSSSGESLMTVINDILDFSKIESGRMELESRSFNVRNCVEEALDLFATQIRIKGLKAVYLEDPPYSPRDKRHSRRRAICQSW